GAESADGEVNSREADTGGVARVTTRRGVDSRSESSSNERRGKRHAGTVLAGYAGRPLPGIPRAERARASAADPRRALVGAWLRRSKHPSDRPALWRSGGQGR